MGSHFCARAAGRAGRAVLFHLPKETSMTWRVDLIAQHIEVENRHLMDEMLATLADENPVRDEVAGRVYRGKDEVAARYAELWQAFPDFNVRPVRYTEQEGIVVMEAIYTGTHHGAYLGLPGSGKSFNVRLVNVFGFDDERIESETIYIDLAGQLRQLGITAIPRN
ncbi:hypothetical protein L522_1298 [Bordetella bronchiseptica MBORD707]|nr:hypothetical protein L522_1298 [Bordetella bronchiseptica MBORD707]